MYYNVFFHIVAYNAGKICALNFHKVEKTKSTEKTYTPISGPNLQVLAYFELAHCYIFLHFVHDGRINAATTA